MWLLTQRGSNFKPNAAHTPMTNSVKGTAEQDRYIHNFAVCVCVCMCVSLWVHTHPHCVLRRVAKEWLYE